MTGSRPATRYSFGAFELDSATGELRRNGLRVKLHTQPFQVLLMLLERPGEMLTREEISRELWPEGTFVDFEHGVNSAVNRLRETLGDKARNPRFIETLARRGYRFLAPVERISLEAERVSLEAERTSLAAERVSLEEDPQPPARRESLLAAPEDLPKSSHRVVLSLFVLLQVMYLAFYVGLLANLAALNEFLAGVRFAEWIWGMSIATAALLIPVRAFLLCAALFRAPGIRRKFLKLWPFLLPLDALWSLAPFLVHGIAYGLALASTTLLVYAPFAQRSLILMGAGEAGAGDANRAR